MQKKRFVFGVIAVVLAALLAACSAPPTAQPAETQVQALPEVSNPNPYPSSGQPANPAVEAPANPPAGGAYPPAAAPAQADGAYPEIADGASIYWEQAVGLLNAGQVSRVTQRHDLAVTLALKDGRTLQTVEPEIDAVLKVIDACGAPCSDIRIATE